MSISIGTLEAVRMEKSVTTGILPIYTKVNKYYFTFWKKKTSYICDNCTSVILKYRVLYVIDILCIFKIISNRGNECNHIQTSFFQSYWIFIIYP